MSERKFINPESMTPPRAVYSWACQVDKTVYLSGQVGIDKDGNTVPGGVEEQVKQAWRNIEEVLKGAGGDLNNVVKATTFVVGKENVPGARAARRAIEEEGLITVRPASTLVVVAGLVEDDWFVEIEATAVLD